MVRPSRDRRGRGQAPRRRWPRAARTRCPASRRPTPTRARTTPCDGAEKAVEAVPDGIAACSGGFAIAADGESLKISRQHRLHVPHGRLRPLGSGGAATAPAAVLDAQVDKLR